MIEQERLKKLIEEEATIYVYMPNFNTLNKFLEYKLDQDDFYRDSKTIQYNLLYETKEEAEFVAKNHDTEIIEFKPPFKLEEDKQYVFCSKRFGVIVIEHNIYGYWVFIATEKIFVPFLVYQEAVDYAHKLFKGEE